MRQLGYLTAAPRSGFLLTRFSTPLDDSSRFVTIKIHLAVPGSGTSGSDGKAEISSRLENKFGFPDV